MQDNRISVIIPAYQAAQTIERALRSVSLQTLKPGEVVIVDDGSNDDTVVAAETLRPIFQEVDFLIFRQGNKGAGAARNKAINRSSGSILAFLDADDEWLPEKLERSMAELDTGSYSLVAHNGWIVDGNDNIRNDCAFRYRAPGDPYENLYCRGYIDTCTVVVKRDLVLQVGGFDESLPNAQDFELWLAILEDPSAKFLVFEDFLARYFVIPGSVMSYTERRRICTLEIAGRYVPILKRRGLRWLKSLLFRVLVIHFEAFTAHSSAKRFSHAFMIPLKAIIALIRALIWSSRKTKYCRKKYVS